MTSLQLLKEKKFNQSIEIEYIDNKILMNQIDMHMAICLQVKLLLLISWVMVLWHTNIMH